MRERKDPKTCVQKRVMGRWIDISFFGGYRAAEKYLAQIMRRDIGEAADKCSSPDREDYLQQHRIVPYAKSDFSKINSESC